MIDCKCKDCDKRTPECHSQCPDYKKFQEENAKKKSELEKRKALYSHNYMKRIRDRNFRQV